MGKDKNSQEDRSSPIAEKREALLNAFIEYERALIDAAIQIDEHYKNIVSRGQRE